MLVISSNPVERGIFSVLKNILNRNATEIFKTSSRTVSRIHLLDAQFRCTGDRTIHALDTKFELFTYLVKTFMHGKF